MMLSLYFLCRYTFNISNSTIFHDINQNLINNDESNFQNILKYDSMIFYNICKFNNQLFYKTFI